MGLVVVLLAGLTGPIPAATDLAAIRPPEIQALQRRLTDAGCYKGAVDGQASPATATAVKVCPDQTPMLRIETGMHTTGIATMDMDAACRHMVTGADDKTVRLWSVPDGHLLNTIRIPISNKDAGDDPLGSVTAVAMSPDGQRLAFVAFKDAGQNTTTDLYVTDMESHIKWHRTLRGSVDHLLFSSDGQSLIVLTAKLQAYDAESGLVQNAVRIEGDQVATSLTISSTGSIFIYDGRTLLRYGMNLSLKDKRNVGEKAFLSNHITVSPNGKFLAALDGRDRMMIIDSDTLQPTSIFDVPSNMSSFSWSGNSAYILYSFNYYKTNTIRLFSLDGRQAGRDILFEDQSISAMKACGAGVFFATSTAGLGRIDEKFHSAFIRRPSKYDFAVHSSSMSDDLAVGRFALTADAKRVLMFDMKSGTVGQAGASNNKLPRRTEPTGDYFLSADGRILVDAADGIVTWRLRTDDESTSDRTILRLYVDPKDDRWVAWTPTGYYMASPGGEDLIGWHLNRGWGQQADFFPASRFRDRFDRPDVVRLVLTTLDEGEAVRWADADAKRRPDTKPLIERLPPVMTILSPADGASVAEGTVEVHYSVRLPSGGTVDHVEAFVDGAKVGARGANRMGAGTPPPADGTAGSIDLPMPDHDVAISLVAYGPDGRASDAARLTLKGSAPARDLAAEDVHKPNLYALLVGVTHYDSKGYDLAYPAADAAGLAAALKSQEGRLYGRVEVKVLTDRDATATGIKRGLNWLGKQITAHDIGIVFAAGHGTTDAKGKFWFLSSDMDPDDISATAVSQGDIENVLFDLPGKKLLFLDACHSGAAFNAGARGGTDIGAAVSDFAQAEGGVVAYAASTGREFSFERSDWGHGAFTKALIEGLGGGADLLHKGTVTTATLDLFVEQRVKDLTGGQQHPVMTRPKTVPDFPIALTGEMKR